MQKRTSRGTSSHSGSCCIHERASTASSGVSGMLLHVGDVQTPDEAIGITVNDAMFRVGIMRKSLGQTLGVAPSVAGRKLRGQVCWSLTDIFRAAELLHVNVVDLMPRKTTAGFEPAIVGQLRFVKAETPSGTYEPPSPASRRPMEGSNLRPADYRSQGLPRLDSNQEPSD